MICRGTAAAAARIGTEDGAAAGEVAADRGAGAAIVFDLAGLDRRAGRTNATVAEAEVPRAAVGAGPGVGNVVA